MAVTVGRISPIVEDFQKEPWEKWESAFLLPRAEESGQSSKQRKPAYTDQTIMGKAGPEPA
jgi:hypothetical protein